jgi:hypothetical protein
MKRYTEQVFTRLTKTIKRDMARAAKKSSQTPSAFIRDAVMEKIQRDFK